MVGFCTGIITFFLTTIFPATNMENAEAISASWPTIMKDLFGDPVQAFTNIYGWLYLQIFHITYWMVISVLAVILASRIVAVEVEKKTIDILLSTPLTRSQLINSRFLALMSILFISMIPIFLGVLFGILLLGYPVLWYELTYTFFVGYLLTICVAGVTLLISVFKPVQLFSQFTTLGLLALMFLFTESLTKLIPLFDKLSFASLFNYYHPSEILIDRSFSVYNPLIFIILTISLAAISSIIFVRKDIYV
jgi:ABC-2 type transport system permease protein